MSSKTELLQQQRNWAELHGLQPDARGYLTDVASNLLRPINSKTRLAFEKGSGSELQDTPTRPAKMKALHSSSALAVNIFDSWVSRDKSALQAALRVDREISSVAFEARKPGQIYLIVSFVQERSLWAFGFASQKFINRSALFSK